MQQPWQQIQTCIEQQSTPLALGIDPHTADLSGFFKAEWVRLGSQKFLRQFCQHMLEACPAVPVKFQMSMFEAQGKEGLSALKECIDLAKQANRTVILDGKRGDIGSTMVYYGQMAFDTLGADILTVAPYLGPSTLNALRPWLTAGKGVYLLWRTSNPDAVALQSTPVEYQGQTTQLADLWLRSFLDNVEAELKPSIGLVLGANQWDALTPDSRSFASAYPLLLPGLGTQSPLRHVDLPDAQPHLFPLSRSLAGLKSTSTHESIHSWEHWAQQINRRFVNAKATVSA